MTLVNDHMMPPDPTQHCRLPDDKLKGRKEDVEVPILDIVRQGLSTLLVSLEDDDLDGGSPEGEFGGPVGDGREGDEDEEGTGFLLLLHEVGNERDGLDGFAETLQA